MALEAWTLDGVALTSGNFLMMELNADPPAPKPQWVSSANSEFAALLEEPNYENREITMKLRVATQASMDLALNQIAAIRDKCRLAQQTADGIQLVWTPNNSARSVIFYVLSGDIVELPIGMDGIARQWFLAQPGPVFTIKLTCKPAWVSATETVGTTATSATPIVTKETTGVGGDFPALGRLIITDGSAQPRRHVEWGVEGSTYDSTTSLILDSDSLVTTGTGGAQATVTGAYDPNASGTNAISSSVGPDWQALVSTGNQSHVGTFRVRARLWNTSTLTAYAALQWRTAAGQTSTNPITAVTSGGWIDVDLGTITIPRVAAGTQAWSGTIIVKIPGITSYATVSVDYILLVPATAGYGRVRSVFSLAAGAVVGGDPFTNAVNQTVLNARVAPVGGTWLTQGAAGDFRSDTLVTSGDGTGQAIVRSSSSEGTARYATLGNTNYTNVAVSVITAPWWQSDDAVGVIARWQNSSNYVGARWNVQNFILYQVVAGTLTQLAGVSMPLSPVRVWRTIRLYVYDTGRAIAQFYDGGFPTSTQPISLPGAALVLRSQIEAQSTALATGGALATGFPGIFDQKSGATSPGHWYDDFTVTVPPAENVALYASGRTLEIRHDSVQRQDSTGTYTTNLSGRGTRFLVPTGTSRVAVKARRNDIEAAQDSNVTDSTTIQVAYRIRGLVAPRT